MKKTTFLIMLMGMIYSQSNDATPPPSPRGGGGGGAAVRNQSRASVSQANSQQSPELKGLYIMPQHISSTYYAFQAFLAYAFQVYVNIEIPRILGKPEPEEISPIGRPFFFQQGYFVDHLPILERRVNNPKLPKNEFVTFMRTHSSLFDKYLEEGSHRIVIPKRNFREITTKIQAVLTEYLKKYLLTGTSSEKDKLIKLFFSTLKDTVGPTPLQIYTVKNWRPLLGFSQIIREISDGYPHFVNHAVAVGICDDSGIFKFIGSIGVGESNGMVQRIGTNPIYKILSLTIPRGVASFPGIGTKLLKGLPVLFKTIFPPEPIRGKTLARIIAPYGKEWIKKIEANGFKPSPTDKKIYQLDLSSIPAGKLGTTKGQKICESYVWTPEQFVLMRKVK